MIVMTTLLPLFYQSLRYLVVGAVSNLIGYLIYLLLTWLWLDPKVAVTLLYPIAAFIGYFSHRKYSFAFSGFHFGAMTRYVVAHLIGYATNVSILYVFSDVLGYAHQLVQAVAVFVVAGVLFLLFRYFVFPQKKVA